MIATVLSRAQYGMEAPLVRVEVHVGPGLPAFSMVGLPEAVVKESRDRVCSALTTAEFEFPIGRITVNLAPADLPKEGGRFDLPIALGILIASGQIHPTAVIDSTQEFYGELGLSGELLPTRGLLLAAAHASRHGHSIVVPCANAQEALIVTRSPVRAANHLLEVCGHLEGKMPLKPLTSPTAGFTPPADGLTQGTGHVRALLEHALARTRLDLRDVRG